MARLSTHVLDTAHGRPAHGVSLRLYAVDGDSRQLLVSAVTNLDGRTDSPLISAERLPLGVFELVFNVAEYFGSQGIPFLGDVIIRFGIEDETANYHVPLLVTPYSYTTYRGS